MVDFGVFFTHTAVRSLEPNNEEVKPMSTKQVNMGFCVQDLFRFNFSYRLETLFQTLSVLELQKLFPVVISVSVG